MGDSQNQKDTSAAPSDGGKQTNLKKPLWKRPPAIVAGTVLIAILGFVGINYLVENFTHESTDDAFLTANVVAVAPRVAGQVAAVHIADNQWVERGDLLVEIDPRDFEVQVAQKKAAQAAAAENVKLIEASFDLLKAQLDTAEATAQQTEAEAAADKANADKAAADLARAEDLNQRKIISPQEYDSAKTAAAAATATLKAGQQKAASDRSKVAGAQAEVQAGHRAYDRARAQDKQTQVDVQQADLSLSYTRITAPQSGRITHKAVQQGDYVEVGQRLLALVPAEIWVTANFKETQLKQIRTNQPARISVDSLPGRALTGRVDSIQAGSGAAFSLLPPENAVGNYVKVVQRVPVKIVFDKPMDASRVLGPGMSVVPSVRVADFEMPEFVVGLVAAILALAVGFLWWRAANRNA